MPFTDDQGLGGQRRRADGSRPTDKPHGGIRVDYSGPAARLRPDPDDNVIIGLDNIKRYIGIRSNSTLWRWVEQYAFPAVKRPDGLWMTTMTAIDQWIFIAAESVNESQRTPRGTNVTAQIALERLQRQVDEGSYEKHMARAARRAAQGVGLAERSRRRQPAPDEGNDSGEEQEPDENAD